MLLALLMNAFSAFPEVEFLLVVGVLSSPKGLGAVTVEIPKSRLHGGSFWCDEKECRVSVLCSTTDAGYHWLLST